MPHRSMQGMKEKDASEEERRLRREREIKEVVRQNMHDNRVRQARLKRPMHQDADQIMSGEILRELAEMREMMTTRRDGGRRQLDEAIEEAGKAPFARQIQLAVIPPKCNLPVVTNIFDGSTCAVQHIRAYNRSLLQWEKNDAVLCKIFPASLTVEALQWFEGFPVGTIRSFHHLQNIFLGQYIINNMLRPDLSYTQIFRIKDTITMAELREFQEEYIALEEKQREMESYPVTIPNTNEGNASLLPRTTNAVASTSQGSHGNKVMEEGKKLVAMGCRDQEEFEREYQEKQFNNRGGNNKIKRIYNHPEGYGGKIQYYNQGPGGSKVVWEQIKMPHLNTAIDKIWEAIILMEDIPKLPNVGNEPPPGRRSREFCAYHLFHSHNKQL
ncbi:uncharacterized protein LOC113343895 [Papaver somniferum]|uniref:uncharacterized protein LOC113343895 n=1 Tax=Papaver somniferum TaxID=3469 RepID=UPI000E6F81ED|nr:uncharacterized protein LOC113343895 [Papaver somniferum]